MEFMNAWMLLGILGISVPVIIHLLNRRSSRVIDWGAFRFLLTSMLKRRRRVLLEEMLLMACRCLVIALLALALARPFIQPTSRVPWVVVMPMILLSIAAFGTSFAMWRFPKWRRRLVAASVAMAALAAGAILFERKLNLNRFGRGAARDVVIVIDGSSSMTLAQGGESNFELARKEAEELVKGARRGTAFGILLGGPVPMPLTPVPLTDKREVFAALDALAPAQGTMRTLNCLTAAAVMLAGGSNPAKQIVVIGDGQAAGWDADAPDRWKAMQAVFGQLPTPPTVIWRTLPLPSSIRNMAVASVTPTREVVGTDREVGFRVTIVNSGTEAVTPREVRLAVDGKILINRTVGQLEPSATHTLTFRHRFENTGALEVSATVVADDDLPADDTATTVVHVIDTLKVLVVDGNPDAPRFDRASTYLSLALRPETQKAASMATRATPDGKAERAFLVAPEVVGAATLENRPSFADCGVVVLADVAMLPDSVAERLADFVAAGGGLLVAPGAHARPEFYNAWSRQGEPVLPLPLFQLATAPVPDSRTLGPSDSRTLGPSDSRTLGPSDSRTLAPSDSRTLGPSDSRTLGPSDSRTPVAPAPETFTGEALRNLRTGSDLGQAVADRWWRLDENSAPGATLVEGRLTNGDPMLASRALGRGRVLVSALPFDASLSVLPSRSHFVPLVHELTYYLANPSSANLNLVPCEGATILLSSGGQTTADATHGLRGTYFRRMGFQGKSIQRVDPGILFDWNQSSPMPRIPADDFSVRWTGTLVPPATGDYRFSAEVDDVVTVYLDEKPVYQCRFRENPSVDATVHLVERHPYAIRVDFEEGRGEAILKLFWKSADMPSCPVPASALLPDPPDASSESAATVRARAPRAASAVDIAAPDGSVFSAPLVETDQGPALRIARALTPGVYHVRPPLGGSPAFQGLLGKDGTLPISVRSDIGESDLTVLSQADQDVIRQYVDLATATKAEDMAKAVGGQSFGSEIWRMLAYATLLLLIAEIFLTRWIALQRKTGEQEVVDLKTDAPTQSDSFLEQLAKFKK